MNDHTQDGVEVAERVERLNEAMRLWYAAFSDLGRQFGNHLGIHSSDAAALVQIASAEDRGEPLTQKQLARRIGLTTAATSSLLNRLEDAGHVERLRDRVDRRVVTLRSTSTMHDQVHAFFREVGEDIDAVVREQNDDLVEHFTRMVHEMTAVMSKHLALAKGTQR